MIIRIYANYAESHFRQLTLTAISCNVFPPDLTQHPDLTHGNSRCATKRNLIYLHEALSKKQETTAKMKPMTTANKPE